MRTTTIDVLATNMITVNLSVIDILAIVGKRFYYISRPIFAFPLVKITFLIIKLIMRKQVNQ